MKFYPLSSLSPSLSLSLSLSLSSFFFFFCSSLFFSFFFFFHSRKLTGRCLWHKAPTTTSLPAYPSSRHSAPAWTAHSRLAWHAYLRRFSHSMIPFAPRCMIKPSTTSSTSFAEPRTRVGCRKPKSLPRARWKGGGGDKKCRVLEKSVVV